MKYLLYPLSAIYNFLSNLNKKFTVSTKLYKPVISVGNITWGGSGKTPVVMETAKYVLSLGKIPVILSRGYARKDKTVKNIIVRNKEKILSDIASSGDEPYMMAQQVQCPVIIGSNRKTGAELAKQFNPDVFILDDGFQHWKLQRDLDIVCVNSLNPFGNGMIIPAGILREKTASLKRADIIVLTNCNLCNEDNLLALKMKIIDITGKEPAEVSYGSFDIVNMHFGKTQDINDIKLNIKFVVLSAIGSPDNFINTIISLGLKISKEAIFSDHHKYSFNDIYDIYKKLQNNEKIITTSKDAVKIKNIINDNIKKDIYILNIAACFNQGRQIFEEKINDLFSKKG